MDSAINEYRKRRADRIEMRRIRPRISANAELPQEITAYRTRRDKRLAERLYKYLNELTDDMRMDAPGDDEQQQNQNGGGSSGGGSHGNTRLPFGLCKRFGIEIGAGWTPKDAWDALAGKGITAEGAYERLRKGEDPGTTDEGTSGESSEGATASGETANPKDTEAPDSAASRRVRIEDVPFVVTGAKYVAGGGFTGKEWTLMGTIEGDPEEDEGEVASFSTKGELLRFLKEQGVEEFEDPETGELLNPKEMEIPVDPVKKIKSDYYGGAEYEKLEGRYISWARRGDEPWRLYGSKIEGSGDGSYAPSRMSETFATKTDMLRYLKEKGVEEFQDPETKEILNPKEMEIPEPVFHRGKTGYTAITLGMRDGMYTVVGTDYDGKKKKIRDFGSLKDAQDYLEGYGAKMEEVKLSSALKKREKERLEWLSSDKKLYFEDGGERYGDISIEESYGGYTLVGTTEEGKEADKRFSTKAELIKYLKDQGVEGVRYGKETINPQDVEIPEAKVTISGRPFLDASLSLDDWGRPCLYATDLDGEKVRLATMYSDGSTLSDFKQRIARDYGLGEDQLSISDEDKQKFEQIENEEREKERRKREFEEKAVEIPGKGRYMDIHIEKDRDGELYICGYKSDGKKRSISYYGDMYDMDHYADVYGLDINSLIKDDDIRKDYERYLDSRKDFDLKATEIGGDKYADISISYEGGMFKVRGYDARGRLKEFSREGSYEDLEKTLNQYGFSPTQFPMDDSATQRKERAIKAKNAIASGGYYSLGKKDSAYKDIRVEEDDVIDNMWKIIGTDPDGNEHVVEDVSSWDDAITKMSDYGVSDYKLKDKTGAEIGKPRYGMHKVMLMRKPGGGFLVFADTKRYGTHAIMYETPKEEEARKWLRDNGVPDGSVKTRGMNPNDDVPRTHTAKSLDKFDSHRMEAIEGSFLDDLSESEKQNAADMLTEVFNKGEYRAARGLNHFGDIIENGYKSQVETGTGGHGAAITKSGRKSVSERMYGHGGIDDTEYEKCGYLAPADDAEDYEDSDHPFYGEMTLTFKKDALKDRATYTWGDSLNTEYCLKSAGYAGENPTIEGLTALYDVDELRSALRAYNRYKKGEISYSEMFKKIRSDANNRYIEMQFHGPVTADDIAKASWKSESDLEKTFSKMSAAKRKRVLKILKDKNIELIYRKRSGSPFVDAWDWIKEHYPDDIPA